MQQWTGGPLFEVHLCFECGSIRNLPLVQANAAVEALGINELFASQEDVDSGRRINEDWRCYYPCYCIWDVDQSLTFGAKVFVDMAPVDLVIGIPPGFVSSTFDDYETDISKPWTTTSAITLHKQIIRRIRAVHSIVPIRAAELGDEGVCGRYSLPERSILIDNALFEKFDHLNDAGEALSVKPRLR